MNRKEYRWHYKRLLLCPALPMLVCNALCNSRWSHRIIWANCVSNGDILSPTRQNAYGSLPIRWYAFVMTLTNQSVVDLLKLHSAVLTELRTRGIVRSANNPTGDLAEFLFCKAFGWMQASNSVKGYDATDAAGTRYQIKARRMHQLNTSRQLSAIRDLDGFDVLAAVLFDADFNVVRGALIPRSVVRNGSKFTTHTNSNRFMLRDDVWNSSGVEDVTAILRAVEYSA